MSYRFGCCDVCCVPLEFEKKNIYKIIPKSVFTAMKKKTNFNLFSYFDTLLLHNNDQTQRPSGRAPCSCTSPHRALWRRTEFTFLSSADAGHMTGVLCSSSGPDQTQHPPRSIGQLPDQTKHLSGRMMHSKD
ncbi:hypothetical protein PYW07_005963 [Mythimna separata]|uniref:Uncharacterized protein n=1 Tax=Mythimna separata TaxID=271217 RepID=A0AAD8DR57_MYTSE|nr:hypothetical protein PYW07_005963 [Mythimna separata]